jgi:hypothetical protein
MEIRRLFGQQEPKLASLAVRAVQAALRAVVELSSFPPALPRPSPRESTQRGDENSAPQLTIWN